MRRIFSLITGVVTAAAITGCSENAPDSGPVPYKATQSPAIDALRDQMAKNAAGGKAAAKTDAAGKAGTDSKAADSKAATDTKDTDKKKD